MAPSRRAFAALLPAAAAAGAACFAVAPLPSTGAPAARAAAASAGVPARSGAAAPAAAVAAASVGGVLVAALAAASKARRSGGALAGGRHAQATRGGARATACRANPTAVFETTLGTFKAELFLDKMPITCSNFIDLCKTGFYDGIHFHRVIPNFMNQFGCPYAKDPRSPRAGTGGPADGTSFEVLDGSGTINRLPGGNIPDELTTKITNGPGTLSMANTGRPNTGGSQFFINVASNDYLDWFDRRSPSAHPVFGEITEGYDLVEKISRVRTVQDAPVEPIMMKSITIEG